MNRRASPGISQLHRNELRRNTMYKAIAISGSLRKSSVNTGMLRFARDNMPQGMSLELLDIAGLPLYNEDTQAEDRSRVEHVLGAIDRADARVLAVPEYNYSVAPSLKNFLDWASREPNNKLLNGKPVALMGAAGGMGSSRAQYHLRQVCVGLNLWPLQKPEVFANAYGGGFDAEGNLLDASVQQAIRSQMVALLEWTCRVRTLVA